MKIINYKKVKRKAGKVMSKKLISLVISLTFIITIGFKEMVYADTYVSGTVTASLNIRSGPSTSYAILGGFSKGSTIKIVEKNGDWLKVQYKTSYGYVSGKYVTSIYDDVIDEGAVINCTYLNVRSGPSSSYSSRGVISKGQKVYIMGKESNWYEILYNGSAGYVSKTYISTTSTGNGSRMGTLGIPTEVITQTIMKNQVRAKKQVLLQLML